MQKTLQQKVNHVVKILVTAGARAVVDHLRRRHHQLVKQLIVQDLGHHYPTQIVLRVQLPDVPVIHLIVAKKL